MFVGEVEQFQAIFDGGDPLPCHRGQEAEEGSESERQGRVDEEQDNGSEDGSEDGSENEPERSAPGTMTAPAHRRHRRHVEGMCLSSERLDPGGSPVCRGDLWAGWE